MLIKTKIFTHYSRPSDIAGEIGFSFSPESLRVNESLTAECVVATQAGLSNPHADITWLGPDGSVFSSQQNVGFKAVGNGISQQEARLSLNFPQFSASNFGEYLCIASITSESLPGARTNLFRSVQIPTIGNPIYANTYSQGFIVVMVFLYQLISPRYLCLSIQLASLAHQ